MAILATGGESYESAVAGTQNAGTFFKQGVCAALAWGFNVFYFEAFDEPSKVASVGQNGKAADETHWGAFTADRKSKFPMGC